MANDDLELLLCVYRGITREKAESGDSCVLECILVGDLLLLQHGPLYV